MALTKAELIERLKTLATCDDPEFAHGEADQLLLDFIHDEEIAAAFMAVEKWYA